VTEFSAVANPGPHECVPVSVGVMAYNEEGSVEQVLAAFLSQTGDRTRVAELVVVCSGCTDTTADLVRTMSTNDRRIRLVVQPERHGKLAAVNEFLKLAAHDVCLISGADTLPSPDLVEHLAARVIDGYGMAGPRIVPLPGKRSLAGSANRLLWEYHHRVASRRPKLGEIVALDRRIVTYLPPVAHCDEVVIEALVTQSGAALAYVPEAVASNRGPTKIRELYRQRRRNHALHLHAHRALGYEASTLPTGSSIAPVLQGMASGDALSITLVLLVLEVTARAGARADFARNRDYKMWEPLASPRLQWQATSQVA
jgi:glycosyltransferase involved in cell wall biosynthesis